MKDGCFYRNHDLLSLIVSQNNGSLAHLWKIEMIRCNYELSVVCYCALLHCNVWSFQLSAASNTKDSFIYAPTNAQHIFLQLYAVYFLFMTQHHRQGIIDFLLICYDDVAFHLPDFLSDMK